MTPEYGAALRRFDAAGGAWLPARENGGQRVTHAGDGSFLVAGGGFVRRYSAAGEPVGEAQRVIADSGVSGGRFARQPIAAQPEGDIVILWRTFLGSGVRDVAGVLVPATRPFAGQSVELSQSAGGLHGHPDLTVMPGHRFLAVWYRLDEWELLVKVLDGCGVTNRFWVFAAATTNVEYTCGSPTR